MSKVLLLLCLINSMDTNLVNGSHHLPWIRTFSENLQVKVVKWKHVRLFVNTASARDETRIYGNHGIKKPTAFGHSAIHVST